jgi:hypothetical protein
MPGELKDRLTPGMPAYDLSLTKINMTCSYMSMLRLFSQSKKLLLRAYPIDFRYEKKMNKDLA